MSTDSAWLLHRGTERMLLTSGEWRPCILLHNLQCPGQLSTTSALLTLGPDNSEVEKPCSGYWLLIHLEMRKVRFRKTGQFILGHTAGKWRLGLEPKSEM